MFLEITYSVSVWTVLHVFIAFLEKSKDLAKCSDLVRVMFYIIILAI